MLPEEARYAALRQFGWTESIKETCREQHGIAWLENLAQDIRHSARQLRKSPGFTAVAVLTLGLGIGAGTAIFSLVNGILLGSLPVPSPQDLRVITWSGADFKASYDGQMEDEGLGRRRGNAFSLAVFRAFREQAAAVGDIFACAPLNGVPARARQEAVTANGLMVSDNFFAVLGVRPRLGRLLDAGDLRPGAAPAVILSYRWWERQFGLDANALGQSVTIAGTTFTVAGVLARDFSGVNPGSETDFYVLLPGGSPHRWSLPLMARLKPGASDAQLGAALNGVLLRESTAVMKQPVVALAPGRAGWDPNRLRYQGQLVLLLGAVGVVLLVACANLAGLSLARGAARHHEFAVRAALGANRGRLLRQSLTENLVVALLGGGLGSLLALWGKNVLARLLAGSPEGLHYELGLDLKVLGFAVAISLVTALLSGMLPALRAAGVNPATDLKTRGPAGPNRPRAGRFLVAAQVTLSLLLLVGAGLYVRTLANLVGINPGFPTGNLLLFQLNPGDAGYPEAQTAAYFDRVQHSLAAIPGVKEVALVQFPLLGGSAWNSSFTLPANPTVDGSERQASMLRVGEHFFRTLGIPLLLGREFRPSDGAGSAKVVVVNEAFARKHFPDGNALGQLLKRNANDWQIVGVCRDAKYADIKAPAPPTVYLPFRQDPQGSAFFAVRTTLPALTIATAARQVVALADAAIPLTGLGTQEQIRDRTITQERLFAQLCGWLAIFAVLLSCIGLYGLLAFDVTRRAGEIGIRMALGATGGRVARQVVREALGLIAIGVAVGVPLTLASTRLIQSHLFGVAPSDPLTFSGAALLLLLVALIAAGIPARRATRINPIVALRSE